MIKAFEKLFRYDETAGFTKNLKGIIATLMFLSEKRINAMKKKDVKHQNIIFAILFSLWT